MPTSEWRIDQVRPEAFNMIKKLRPHVSRGSAFGIHLAISLTVFFALLGVLTLAWYPSPIFAVEGGWKGLRLVALVDVVLGPLLTLVIFKPGKPGLKLDMSLIVAFQLAALAWGVWTLHSTRPVLLVFADDSFRAISAAQLGAVDPDGKIAAQWVGESLARVYVDLPADPVEFADSIEKARSKGASAHLLSERYERLEDAWDRVIDDSLDINRYVGEQAAWRKRLDDLLKHLGKSASELVFLPYVGRYDRAILVADRKTKQLVDVLDIPYDPAAAHKVLPMRARIANPKGTGEMPHSGESSPAPREGPP